MSRERLLYGRAPTSPRITTFTFVVSYRCRIGPRYKESANPSNYTVSDSYVFAIGVSIYREMALDCLHTNALSWIRSCTVPADA